MDNNQSWYEQLNKPTWAPQPEVFGRVWSIIYPIIFVVNGYVVSWYVQKNIPLLVALPFWLNLGANLLFTPLQLGLKNQFVSFFAITVVLVTIIWAMVAILPYHRWVAVAYLPYLLWVCIATVLQYQLWRLNR